MVRTRFAPSPTGYLHIGGVRTALFNWLFARKHGGQFILRIDDTDAERNVAEALAPILHGFRWLDIDWDEGAEVGGPHGPYYQSQKLPRYQAAVQQLLDSGHAYWDFTPPDAAKAERDAAEKQKRLPNYRGAWMATTEEERRKFVSQGLQPVVRQKMPREGHCEFFDHIRGDMRVEWASEQDHVIQRADGTCLYNLASVVDDYDHKITHVIRAQEHLSNTPRQIFIVDALGYPRPEYAHLPFVAEPGSSNKLSKRKLAQYLKNADFKKVHDRGLAIAKAIGLPTSDETFNPVIVDFYEQIGYLPDAIVNYLLLLGWSLDDKTEFFTRQEMIDAFTLERVNKAPASFDVKKLGATFQEHYMNQLELVPKVSMVANFARQAKFTSAPSLDGYLGAIVQAAGERIKIAGDIIDYADFYTADDELPIDDKAFDKRIRKPEKARELLRQCRQALAEAPAFDPAGVEQVIVAFTQQHGIELGDIIHALRVATTGKGVGFGLYDTLAILGQPRVLNRIDLALARA